jgi:hypothetical protein
VTGACQTTPASSKTHDEIKEIALFKTRTRMISFRLSEEEYERVRDLSLMEHARSVSDYARDALCRLPHGNGVSRDSMDPRVDGLEGAVKQLRADLQQLSQLIEHTLGRGQGGAAKSGFPEKISPAEGQQKELPRANRKGFYPSSESCLREPL